MIKGTEHGANELSARQVSPDDATAPGNRGEMPTSNEVSGPAVMDEPSGPTGVSVSRSLEGSLGDQEVRKLEMFAGSGATESVQPVRNGRINVLAISADELVDTRRYNEQLDKGETTHRKGVGFDSPDGTLGISVTTEGTKPIYRARNKEVIASEARAKEAMTGYNNLQSQRVGALNDYARATGQIGSVAMRSLNKAQKVVDKALKAFEAKYKTVRGSGANSRNSEWVMRSKQDEYAAYQSFRAAIKSRNKVLADTREALEARRIESMPEVKALTAQGQKLRKMQENLENAQNTKRKTINAQGDEKGINATIAKLTANVDELTEGLAVTTKAAETKMQAARSGDSAFGNAVSDAEMAWRLAENKAAATRAKWKNRRGGKMDVGDHVSRFASRFDKGQLLRMSQDLIDNGPSVNRMTVFRRAMSISDYLHSGDPAALRGIGNLDLKKAADPAAVTNEQAILSGLDNVDPAISNLFSGGRQAILDSQMKIVESIAATPPSHVPEVIKAMREAQQSPKVLEMKKQLTQKQNELRTKVGC